MSEGEGLRPRALRGDGEGDGRDGRDEEARATDETAAGGCVARTGVTAATLPRPRGCMAAVVWVFDCAACAVVVRACLYQTHKALGSVAPPQVKFTPYRHCENRPCDATVNALAHAIPPVLGATRGQESSPTARRTAHSQWAMQVDSQSHPNRTAACFLLRCPIHLSFFPLPPPVVACPRRPVNPTVNALSLLWAVGAGEGKEGGSRTRSVASRVLSLTAVTQLVVLLLCDQQSSDAHWTAQPSVSTERQGKNSGAAIA
jgi:hypothetical protein